MSDTNLTLDCILDSFVSLIMGSSESKCSENPQHQLPQIRFENERQALVAANTSHSSKHSDFYFGKIETITGKRSAIVCIAHRNFMTLKWDENWLQPGVSLERVLLLAQNLMTSTGESGKYLVKPLYEVLEVGEPVKVSRKPTHSKDSDKCYEWFATHCWKIAVSECQTRKFPMESLTGHMSGVIESVNNHYGVIKFNTYVGTTGKAFFNRSNLVMKSNRNSNNIPIVTVAKIGTEVFLVVNRWWKVGNLSEFDKNLFENDIHFKAVQVWAKESHDYLENKPYVIKVGNAAEARSMRKEPTYERSPPTGNDENLNSPAPPAVNKNKLNGEVQGVIMSFDEDWGLIKVGDEIVILKQGSAFLYGLELKNIPLQRVFFPDQVVKMYMKNGDVIKLEYGSPQSGESRKRAILIYCDKNYVSSDIKGKLEILMEQQQ